MRLTPAIDIANCASVVLRDVVEVHSSDQGATWTAEQRISVPVGNSHALGPSNAPVTMIEFIDYQ